jgi:hypothetical protein
MNEHERQPGTLNRPPVETPPVEDAYPSSVESLSEKWRTIQPNETAPKTGSFLQRNPTALGIGIGVALVIFLAIVGGFVLLVWTVNR